MEVLPWPVPPESLKRFLSKLKVAWRQWDVHTMVVTSFSIQVVLILIGPFRKKSSSRVIALCAWLAYLLADWVAAQAIGLVSKPCGSELGINADQAELYAFWAQFLLLHLGGPDTITALALQDSELWLRTGLHLCVQVYGTGGVLFRSISQSQSSLWAPTLLMFVAGVIKYTERLSSLFHGRLLKFSYQGSFTDPRDSPQYLPDELDKKFKPGDIDQEKEKTDVAMVRDAFCFFSCTKGLYAGQKLAQAQPEDDLLYFSRRTPEEAFRVLEIQLNLAYEAFYTKTVIICTQMSWKALRLVVTLLQVGCLVIWMFFTDKQGFPHANIRITYTMLVGALVVDVYAFFRIQFWSDWTIAQLRKDSPIIWFYNMLLSSRKRTWGTYLRKEDAPIWAQLKRALFRRWSESIPQFNLITMYCYERSNNFINRVIKFVGVGEEMLERSSIYVTRKWFNDHLRDFIFVDLMEKATMKGAFENIGNVKGGWACGYMMYTHNRILLTLPNVTKLLDIRGEYDLILMYWHVITELLYIDENHVSNEGDDEEQNLIKRLKTKLVKRDTSTTAKKLEEGHEPPKDTNNMEERDYREICKTLSDYMMYLLIYQQEMMPITDPYVTNGRLFWLKRYLQSMRFRAIEEGEPEKEDAKESSLADERQKKDALRQIICKHARCNFYMGDPRTELENTYIQPIIDELMTLEEQIGKWEFMAKVWGELLYYAAIRSKPRLHAAKLKQGGELLSFVWLLLVQLGFGIQGSNNSRYETEPERAQLYAYNIDGVGESNWGYKHKPRALDRK